MLVARLVLKNWRNFRFAVVRRELRVFTGGPNASGKANLLGVFGFEKDSRRGIFKFPVACVLVTRACIFTPACLEPRSRSF